MMGRTNLDLQRHIERVAGKLAAAANRHRHSRRRFGADHHGFRLGPPLPEAEVASFEHRHSVVLPADYRAFITRIGHGGTGSDGNGAGPYYGLLPLDQWDAALEQGSSETVLATPFPADPDHKYQDWWAEAGLDDDQEVFPGAIALADEGCGVLSLLVVTGTARGRVASTYWGETGPIFSPAPGFLSWYEQWLDGVLAGKHR
ncbi:MAG TPA: SMI1/KNR4 family protein [Micromonospora sp.]|nr:SMI1/KNR4 family protein [Micromonospora sp.]